jgi:hypothetical protein
MGSRNPKSCAGSGFLGTRLDFSRQMFHSPISGFQGMGTESDTPTGGMLIYLFEEKKFSLSKRDTIY